MFNLVHAGLSIGFSTKLIRLRHWVQISGICWQHPHYHYLGYRTVPAHTVPSEDLRIVRRRW